MFKKVSEGFVYKAQEGGRVACGPRTALLPDGRIVCSYMTQTKIGRNDFRAMAAYSDDGESWYGERPVWPQWEGVKSPFVSVRNTPDGRVSVAGIVFKMEGEDEVFWSDEAAGMKENKLCWCISDDGISFPEPSIVDPAYYASAEQPGGMLVRRNGEMIMIYAPYDTIKKKKAVETNKLMMMTSRDGGKSFEPSVLGSVTGKANFAESWIVELADGGLFASSWLLDGKETPDVCFVSRDGWASFEGPFDMKLGGQTTSLTPYGGDKVLVAYNQRANGAIGVWLALGRPGRDGFETISNEPVWQAQTATRNNTSGEFDNWTDYSFGEPHAAIMADGSVIVVFWCIQPGGTGIRYVKLEPEKQ